MWSVVRLETVDGTECYVVKSGETGEVYFRRADLAWTMDKVNGTIESQATPPDLRYVWPLEVRKRWDVSYILNRPDDRTTAKRQRECEVLAWIIHERSLCQSDGLKWTVAARGGVDE